MTEEQKLQRAVIQLRKFIECTKFTLPKVVVERASDNLNVILKALEGANEQAP